jgi:hypothetical protein
MASCRGAAAHALQPGTSASLILASANQRAGEDVSAQPVPYSHLGEALATDHLFVREQFSDEQ